MPPDERAAAGAVAGASVVPDPEPEPEPEPDPDPDPDAGNEKAVAMLLHRREHDGESTHVRSPQASCKYADTNDTGHWALFWDSTHIPARTHTHTHASGVIHLHARTHTHTPACTTQATRGTHLESIHQQVRTHFLQLTIPRRPRTPAQRRIQRPEQGITNLRPGKQLCGEGASENPPPNTHKPCSRGTTV